MEQYYLISKSKLDVLLEIHYTYQQKQIIDAVIANSKLIDLNDENIEKLSEKYCKHWIPSS